MSYKNQTIEWDVPEADVQIGVPVGYEVELSQNSFYNPILYKLNTYNETTASIQGVFFYSLDDGATWIDFPIGEAGQVFYSAYKMRVVINAGNTGYIFAEKNGVIYRIAPDGSEVIENYTIDDFSSSDIGIDTKTNALYVSGQESTLYKVDTHQVLQAGDNSVNLQNEALGIAIDGTRDSFWQVDRSRVYLKDFEGDTIFSVATPFDIDVDYSSSSSSSSSSFSSSSSSSSSQSSSSSSSSSESSSSSSSSYSSSSSSSEGYSTSSSSSSTSNSSESSESQGGNSSSSSSSSSLDSSSSSSSEGYSTSSSSSSSTSISSESSSSSSSESSSSSSSSEGYSTSSSSSSSSSEGYSTSSSSSSSSLVDAYEISNSDYAPIDGTYNLSGYYNGRPQYTNGIYTLRWDNGAPYYWAIWTTGLIYYTLSDSLKPQSGSVISWWKYNGVIDPPDEDTNIIVEQVT